MVVVDLFLLAEILRFFGDEDFSTDCFAMARQVDHAINMHGLVIVGDDQIYAFEVDGCENTSLKTMPTCPTCCGCLFWITILIFENRCGWMRGMKFPSRIYPKINSATRSFILFSQSPHWFSSTTGLRGLGSKHASVDWSLSGMVCRRACVWHLGMIAEGMTSDDPHAVMANVLRSDGGTGVLHEGFHPDDPSMFNRESFGWANAFLPKEEHRRGTRCVLEGMHLKGVYNGTGKSGPRICYYISIISVDTAKSIVFLQLELAGMGSDFHGSYLYVFY